MLRYTPKKNKKGRLASLFLALFGGALMLFAVTSGWRYGLYLQLVALFLWVLAFEFLYRYELVTYTYLVSETEFAVLRRVGKRTRIMCGLSLKDAVMLARLTKKKTDLQGKAVRYNFTASMGAKAPYSIVFEDGYKLFEIIFEPNEEMCAFLRDRICENGEG